MPNLVSDLKKIISLPIDQPCRSGSAINSDFINVYLFLPFYCSPYSIFRFCSRKGVVVGAFELDLW